MVFGAGGGMDLGTAHGRVIIDASGVGAAMQQAQGIFSGGLAGIGQGIQGIGQQMSNLGGQLAVLTAPIAAFGAAALSQFTNFNEAITNIQAVTGASVNEIAALSDEILAIGENSRAGPQAVAEAFYDIAGGIVDASSRMPTLRAAVAAAEAGNASLTGTTRALISIMNGFGLSADQATTASDILTRTVNVGVGTMDEFAAALPNVAGLAASVGISFEDLGAMTAFLTTKGVSATEATTQLSGMIVSLIRPSKEMAAALAAIGYESGQAAIEQLGLVGAFDALAANGADIPEVTGRIEALRGAIALTGEGAQEFIDNFANGLAGLTEATRAIQNASPAAQLDFFNSAMSTLSITIGESLAPALVQLLQRIMPIIDNVLAWVRENPELVAQIGMVVGAIAGLAPVLIIAGKAISAVGAILSIAFSPIGLIIAALAGLFLAFQTNFLGIRDLLGPFVDNFIGNLDEVWGSISRFGQNVENFGLGTAIASVIDSVMEALGLAENSDEMSSAAQGIGDTIAGVFGTIGDYITNVVLPVLTTLYNWFVTDALPAIIAFITGSVVPVFQSFFGFLGDLWAIVGPHLERLVTWFINEGLPAILEFISGTVIPGIGRFVDFLRGIWDAVAPHLLNLANWFLNDALPAVVAFVETTIIPGIQKFVDFLVGIWEIVRPELEHLWEWFTVTALPAVRDFIVNEVMPRVQGFVDILEGIWTVVSVSLGELYTWFVTEGLPEIQRVIGVIHNDYIIPFRNLLRGLWDAIRPHVQAIVNWFRDFFADIGTRYIQPVLDFVNDLIQRVQDALEWLRRLGGGAESGGPGVPAGATAYANQFLPPAYQYAGGISFVPDRRLAMLDPGERVLTAAENREYSGGGGGGGLSFDGAIFNINANSEAEGRAAARGFEQELAELWRSRGN